MECNFNWPDGETQAHVHPMGYTINRTESWNDSWYGVGFDGGFWAPVCALCTWNIEIYCDIVNLEVSITKIAFI